MVSDLNNTNGAMCHKVREVGNQGICVQETSFIMFAMIGFDPKYM